MEMIELTLYLQSNYNGTFSLAEKIDKEFWGCDYNEVARFGKFTLYADIVKYAKSIG